MTASDTPQGARVFYRFHIHFIRAAVTATVLLTLLWPLLGLCEEEDPTISLIKTIEVRQFEDLKFSADDYEVQAGDSLHKILVKRKVIGPGPMPVKLMSLIKTLNKDLTNPDLIVPGQKLVLPKGPVDGLPVPPPLPEEKPKPERTAEAPGNEGEISPDGRYRTVKIKKGQTLSELLRNEGVPDRHIFNEYLNLTLRLNPYLSNPNVIYAGVELKLPLKADWAETAIAGRGDRQSRPQPKTAPTSTRVKPKRTARVKPKKPRTTVIVPPPALPPSKSLAVRTALGLIFTRMGETYVGKGQHFLPLKTGGQITINAKSFPILELQNGQRIVLDLDQRLPQEMVELIRSNWSNYTIFRPNRNESLPKMMDRLFKAAQYYKVQTKGQPWVLEREVKVKIEADWIIWPTAEDWSMGRAVVITVPSSPSQGTAPELAEYLTARGVQVIDFHPQGNMIGPQPRPYSSDSMPEIQDMTINDYHEFALSLLGLLNQKYETDLDIPLIRDTGSGQGFNFTVHAPIYFTRGGTNYVLAPDGMTEDVEELLKKHKFKVITRYGGEGPQVLAQRLLSTLGVATESGLTVRSSRSSKGSSIEVTMPGVVFNAGGHQMLLTASEVPLELGPLFRRPRLKVVKYAILNQS
jgi:LysM repeat protein